MRSIACYLAGVFFVAYGSLTGVAEESTLIDSPLRLNSVVPPLDSAEHMSTPGDEPPTLPISDTPFFEHVRKKSLPRREGR